MSSQQSPITKAFPTKNIEICLDQLNIEDGIQSRAEIDQTLVTEYAEEMSRGTKFPPIIVFSDGTKYWLVDGFHRVLAAKTAGLTTIAAEVRTGSARDALFFSAGVNKAHGLRRSNLDKRKAVTILLADPEWGGWSDRVIAEHCGVSHSFVSSMRAESSVHGLQMQRTAVRNGVEYSMDTSRIGKGQQALDDVENCNTGIDADVHGVDGAIKNPAAAARAGFHEAPTPPPGLVAHTSVASPADWAKQTWIPVKGSVVEDISHAVLTVIPESTPVNKELQSFLNRAVQLGFAVFVTPGLQGHVEMPQSELPPEEATEAVQNSPKVKRKWKQESPLEGDLW